LAKDGFRWGPQRNQLQRLCAAEKERSLRKKLETWETPEHKEKSLRVRPATLRAELRGPRESSAPNSPEAVPLQVDKEGSRQRGGGKRLPLLRTTSLTKTDGMKKSDHRSPTLARRQNKNHKKYADYNHGGEEVWREGAVVFSWLACRQVQKGGGENR